jgi:hypothetical protein
MGPLMKAFAVKTSIRATPEHIWALLTDAASYTRWNHTVEKVDGKIARGERITVHPKINASRAFPIKVAEWGRRVFDARGLWGGDGSADRPLHSGFAACI